MNAINRYIDVNNIIVDKQYIYEDKYSASRGPKGSSIDDAKPFTRKGLNELINDAKLNKFGTIMVFNHDRLTRNVQESLLLNFLFEKLKINVIYCKPGENVNTGSEKLNTFFENLLNNLSALESNMIGSRTRIGNEYNIKNGYWAGGPAPYGYKLNKSPGSKKSVLKICYPEARIVIEIFNLYLQGLSPVKIAEFIKNKYPHNTDRNWTKNSIISIISNKDYTGVMVWNKKGGVRNPVKHEIPIIFNGYKENIIINPEQWEQVENIKAIQKEHPKFFSSPFILNGYLVCEKCGNIMKTKNNGIKKGRVYYCIEAKDKKEPCIKEKGKDKWETCIKAEIIEPTVIKKLGEHLTHLLSNNDNFNIFYENYEFIFNARKRIYIKSITELQSQLDVNINYISDCKFEINELEQHLNYKTEGNEYLNFIESLKELHSYLIINGNIIAKNMKDIDAKASTIISSSDTLKKFILQKKNLLDTLKTNITDKETYQRSLKLLLYDLVDKIVLSEDAKSIEIILK